MSSSTSSSEDERIKEAIDGDFLTKDLYADGEVRKKSKSPPKQPVSLRNQICKEVSTNPFSLKVTPEFQKHVSEHLSKLLDKTVDDSEIIPKSKKLKTKRNVTSRIKLLSTSEDYLTTIVSNKPTVKIRKYVREENLNETDYEERAKEVAVSPKWVLSQEETRYWAPCTKGEVEIVKLNEWKKSSTGS